MIRAILGATAWGVLAAASAAVPAAAHPHVFVEGSATLNFGADRRVETIMVSYALDELTTAVLIDGLDANGNGLFERSELQALAEENAAALAEFDYFVEVNAGGEQVPVAQAVGYNYEYEGERLVLFLSLALERPISPAGEPVSIRLYDPTFYVLVELSEEAPLYVDGVEPEFCAVAVKGPSLASEGVSLSDAVLGTFDPAANIGRDYADEIKVACGAATN